MIEALYAAESGMYAQQASINVTASNVANINTPAFKKGRVEFKELMARTEPVSSGGNTALTGGVAVTSVGHIFSPGEMKQTGRAMDLAIRGDGFFEVMLSDGSTAYTRNGSFQVTNEGMLVTPEGYVLSPMVQLRSSSGNLVIGPDGRGALLDDTGATVETVELELTRFMNPEGLKALGGGLYTATDSAGEPARIRPGEQGAGVIAQGYVEVSNVELVNELSQLMLAQRAMELNSRVAQVSNEILGLINDLKKN